MQILLAIILLVLGFVLLIKGADWFVDGAAGIAVNIWLHLLQITAAEFWVRQRKWHRRVNFFS